MIVRKFARYWVKGNGVAYTTSTELATSSEFWRQVREAAKVIKM